MARLTYVYRTEDISYVKINRRQLPVVAEQENLMLLMDLSKGLAIDSPQIRGKDLEEFRRKFNLLTADELRESLQIDNATFIAVLNQCVQCVGCRRHVERLFYQLTLSGHPTLYPLILQKDSTIGISEEKMKTPRTLGTVLYRHHDVLNNLLENKLRNKTRCLMHSLDTFRSKPFSETWRELWSSMKQNCRDELAVIETKELHDVMDNYLKKHKFCQGCRTKIEKAYKILIGETTGKEKGFVSMLYANVKKCHPDKHIHLITNKIEFLDAIIRRAEPEVNGSSSFKQRERHAKTLEIAQEEVLTCVGMILYERLRRIYLSLREEERACQVLAGVAVHALCRSFDTAVERKQGFSNLELLYQEMDRSEKAKEQKRAKKNLRKKKKKNMKNCCVCEDENPSCSASESAEEEYYEEVESLEDGDDEGLVDDMGEEISLVEEDDDEEEETETAEETVPGQSEDFLPVISHKKKKPQKPKQKQKQNPQQKRKKANQPQKLPLNTNTKNNVNTDVSHTMTLASFSPSSSESLPVPDNCSDCLESTTCPCESDVKDAGYGSEPHWQENSRTSSIVSTPAGSEVSCSDGCCHHDANMGGALHDLENEPNFIAQHCGNEQCESMLCHQQLNTLSLQQMLDNDNEEIEDEENCYIPQEVVLEFQCQHDKVQQQRQQLRETLRQNFARLCMQKQAGDN